MTADRHLIIQELALRPAGEWKPDARGWTVARVVEGAGYCLQGGGAHALNAGDMLVTGPVTTAVIRASQLGLLKLEFYLVLPQNLNGLVTVNEWRQLEDFSSHPAPRILHFAASDAMAQKFARFAAQPQRDGLAARSSLLQLWASAIHNLLPAAGAAVTGGHLRERFRQLIGKMAETELAARSLTELAEELHCSERHFSRLFREEFKMSLRSCQVELRLQRARQLLAASNSKIINVAYESGFRHLGLFNAMFKRRFGATPSAWRQQNAPAPAETVAPRGGLAVLLFLLLAQIFFSPGLKAQPTNPPVATTNAAPKGFPVEKYLVSGNTILPPEKLGGLFTNLPNSFGTNVTIDGIRAALGELQKAYRERGYVTVSVGLPPQKLTNAVVKVTVTEGRLAAINVKGNNYFSTENVLRALPSLHTNMLLNSHVFQRELDLANANRDRQIYPVIGPGLEPGTSELTLKVKDRFPVHARVELNNVSTPGTPDNRVAFSAQYGNLWQLEHQVGVQYTFTPLNFARANNFYFSQIDLPLIANYSAYYRLPLGRRTATQQQIDASNGRFGYNEISHQFQMPPPSGRPELTVYTSRSRNDTDVQLGTASTVISSPLLTIVSQDSGQNVTLNEGIGAKLALPLPALGRLSSTLTLGLDFKHFQSVSYNSNNFYATTYITNTDGSVQPINSTVSSPQPVRYSMVEYLPLNLGCSGSVPDAWGTTFFNAQANFNLAVLENSIGAKTNYTHGGFSNFAYSPKARDHYLTVQAGLTREQRLYRDWTLLFRADGQWANSALFSNEQFGMGGTAGVRGYLESAGYGDTGWRMAIEPRTPLVNIGMVDGDIPFWVRASVFMDYGEIYLLQKIAGLADAESFWGAGCSLTANIGSHLDARLTVAWPLIGHVGQDNQLKVYFGAGAQF